MSIQFTKTALCWCLGKGQIKLRGRKQLPWLEIIRPETENPYLTYQLLSLRRSHDGPYDEDRCVLASDDFYDNERILFGGEGMHTVYELLYPRDVKTISKQVLDLTGLMGLTALWIDQGRIDECRAGQIKGRFNCEEYDLIRDALQAQGIDARRMVVGGVTRAIRLKPPVMQSFARLIRPYAHFSMKAKLQLRKSPPGSGQTRSQPTDHLSNALLRRVGQHADSKRSWPQIRQGKQQVKV